VKIVEATTADLEAFYVYLNAQLEENNTNSAPSFQPLSKACSYVSEELKAKFQDGFQFEMGQTGWRKLWLAKEENNTIIGHIDLRQYNEPYKAHRVMLGMGVESRIRRQGVGAALINAVVVFCQHTEHVRWLDLNVLSNNLPAQKLYEKCGFKVIGNMSDCYRIDGHSVDELTMTRAI